VRHGHPWLSVPMHSSQRLGIEPPNVGLFEKQDRLRPLRYGGKCFVPDGVGAPEIETSPTLGLRPTVPRVRECDELTPNSAQIITPNNSQSNRLAQPDPDVRPATQPHLPRRAALLPLPALHRRRYWPRGSQSEGVEYRGAALASADEAPSERADVEGQVCSPYIKRLLLWGE
jgi:hypothetical protein